MKSEPKVILIYNPIAHGGKLAEKTKNSVLNVFPTAIMHPIEPGTGDGFGNLEGKIRREQPDFLIIAGGDGTLNRYYNYAFRKGLSKLPIGIIPSGTANDFAGSLGISSDIKKAVSQIKNGKENSVDIMAVRSGDRTDYCINVFSSGYLTCVSHTTSDNLKKKVGRLAYFIHGSVEAIHPQRMPIKIETDTLNFSNKALLFLVMNGQTAGRMSFAKTASPRDGLLDLRIFRGSSILGTISSLTKMLLGKDYSNDVISAKCSYLKIDNSHNNETDLDGDRGPSYPIHINCLKGAINVRF